MTHVITGLQPHGAELALLRLISETQLTCHHSVIVISNQASLRPEFEAAGADVYVAGLRRRRPSPMGLYRLGRAMRSSRPTIVQTWLPAADFLGGLTGRLVARRPVIWNLRISDVSRDRWGLATYLVCRVNALLSRTVPKRIAAVGRKTAESHQRLGFDPDRMVIIHNGFEIPPAPPGKEADRVALGLPLDGPVVCRLARYHPDKDVTTLLLAWRRVIVTCPSARLLLAGRGLEASNLLLADEIDRLNVAGTVALLGELDDPTTVYRASDITVSSSLAEGLPNVIGEAMAHGLPAVVTDVGDSAELVGTAGRVVPPADPVALGDSMVELMLLDPTDRAELGASARRQIQQRFSMKAMADRYLQLWREVADVRS